MSLETMQLQTHQQKAATPTPIGGILQRKCACGNHTVAGGECAECAKKKHRLQRKLVIGASNDPLEREADRVADQVLAGPTHPTVNSALPRIHRYTGQATPGVEAPASVDRVLAGSGKPLEPALRQEMEQCFCHDFSQVRVHSGAAAEQSARDVNANAYTVGHNIVFGAGQLAPQTRMGWRLIAHELTHVVQQSRFNTNHIGQGNGKSGPFHFVPGPSIAIRVPANLLLQRDDKETSGTVTRVQGVEFILPDVKGGAEELAEELLRRGILKREDYTGWVLLANGYYFTKSSGSGPTYRVLDALEIRDEKGDVTGYRVISYLHSPSQTKSPSQGKSPTQDKSPSQGTQPKPSKKPDISPDATKKPESKKPAKQAPQTKQPVEPASAKTAEQMRADFEALPDSVKDLLRGGEALKPENLAQVLRIANKLKQLQPEDLVLYKLLAQKLAADLDAFERSVDFFVQFKEQIRAQANTEKKKDTAGKEPTLEEKLAKTWSGFDEKKFGTMDTGQKEDLAREIAAQQRNVQLEHMADHPGETAVGMVEGMVRLDKTAAAIAEDVKDAANGDKGAYTRIAGAVGAYNKYLAAAASIVFIALLFVPGVNLLELAAAGLAVAAASIVLSVTESELRIKAAGEAKTAEEFKTETAKSAAAQTQAVVAAAMMALTLAMKIVARIPLPGRYQNVGAALGAAQKALIDKSGAGAAWQSVKTDLLGKLRSSKQGLPEALAQETKAMSETAKVVEGMSGDEFVKQLAAGDPKLADLGITPEQAKAIQQLATTPEGKSVPGRLQQDSLKALQEAPVEAGKKVDQFVKNVDDSIQKIEKAQSQEQLKSAVDEANSHLSPKEQARQAVADEQSFVKKRVEGARRSGIREQAQKKLDALQTEQAKTQAKIAELDKELREANLEVKRLSEKVKNSPEGSSAKASAREEFKAAKEALDELREADELGGYREERAKQNKAEEAILESLELKRPGLWQATKDAIRKAAKRNADGKFLDANTGEVIQGEPVYGHIKGREHRRLALKAAEKGMTQEQFTKWVNDHPEWFQLETKANNESHRFELKGTDGWEKIE